MPLCGWRNESREGMFGNMKSEFYFPSKDGNTEIHTIEWKPEGEVKAVLQMCHGMVEYIDRYDEFAQYLCGQGFYVVFPVSRYFDDVVVVHLGADRRFYGLVYYDRRRVFCLLADYRFDYRIYVYDKMRYCGGNNGDDDNG